MHYELLFWSAVQRNEPASDGSTGDITAVFTIEAQLSSSSLRSYTPSPPTTTWRTMRSVSTRDVTIGIAYPRRSRAWGCKVGPNICRWDAWIENIHRANSQRWESPARNKAVIYRRFGNTCSGAGKAPSQGSITCQSTSSFREVRLAYSGIPLLELRRVPRSSLSRIHRVRGRLRCRPRPSLLSVSEPSP